LSFRLRSERSYIFSFIRRKISCPELGNDNDDNLAYEPELPSDFLVLLMPHVG
jgi:hypothetical protein